MRDYTYNLISYELNRRLSYSLLPTVCGVLASSLSEPWERYPHPVSTIKEHFLCIIQIRNQLATISNLLNQLVRTGGTATSNLQFLALFGARLAFCCPQIVPKQALLISEHYGHMWHGTLRSTHFPSQWDIDVKCNLYDAGFGRPLLIVETEKRKMEITRTHVLRIFRAVFGRFYREPKYLRKPFDLDRFASLFGPYPAFAELHPFQEADSKKVLEMLKEGRVVNEDGSVHVLRTSFTNIIENFIRLLPLDQVDYAHWWHVPIRIDYGHVATSLDKVISDLEVSGKSHTDEWHIMLSLGFMHSSSGTRHTALYRSIDSVEPWRWTVEIQHLGYVQCFLRQDESNVRLEVTRL